MSKSLVTTGQGFGKAYCPHTHTLTYTYLYLYLYKKNKTFWTHLLRAASRTSVKGHDFLTLVADRSRWGFFLWCVLRPGFGLIGSGSASTGGDECGVRICACFILICVYFWEGKGGKKGMGFLREQLALERAGSWGARLCVLMGGRIKFGMITGK